MSIEDLVKDTSTSVGAGNFITSGAPAAPFRAFTALGPVGQTFGYKIAMGAIVETGIGTVVALAPFEFARAPAKNAQPLNFGAGTKEVEHVVTAAEYSQFQKARPGMPFSTTIQLSAIGVTSVAQQAISAAVNLVVAASPVTWAFYNARFVADGVAGHVVSVAGALEDIGSAGYDNRAGICNVLWVWNDGYDTWCKWSQAANAVPTDITRPVQSTATVANATPTSVDITFNEGMNTSSVPDLSTVTIGGHTVSALAWLNNITLRATVTQAFVNGEAARAVAYVSNGTNNLRDVAGNHLLNFSGLAVSNGVGVVATMPAAPTIGTAIAGDGYIDVYFTRNSNGGSAVLDTTAVLSTGQTATGTTSPIRVVATNGAAATATVKDRNSIGSSASSAASNSVTPAATGIQLSPRSADLTVSGSPPVYTGTGVAYSASIGGVATKGLQAGADGSFEMQFSGTAGGSEIMLQIQAQATVVAFTAAAYAFYTQVSTGTYQAFSNGGAVGVSSVAFAAGDRMRARRTGSGGAANTATLIAEKSSDGGSTWTTIYTWSNVSTGVLHFQAVVGTKAGTISNLVDVGLA